MAPEYDATLCGPGRLHILAADPPRQHEVPSSSTKKQVAGSPSAKTGPGSKLSTWPSRHSQSSCSSVSFSNRNSVRSSSGLHRSGSSTVNCHHHSGLSDILAALFRHRFSRYLCTRVTAMAPSPTALATRLTDSARTSPATNTPGMLVSRW